MAGEYLVCSDLSYQNISVTHVQDNKPYDIIAEISGKFVRIQVKTSPIRKANGYAFYLLRRSTNDLNFSYHVDFDILAYVFYDIGKISYMPWQKVPKLTVVRFQSWFDSPFQVAHEQLL